MIDRDALGNADRLEPEAASMSRAFVPRIGLREEDINSTTARRRFKAYGRKQISRLRQLQRLTPHQLASLKIASLVLPFRVNDYVLDELIDWNNIPSDPIFQLTFPQAEMLDRVGHFHLQTLLASGADPSLVRQCARAIQMRMNPHPDGQMELNIPTIDGSELSGCQHKYRETVLFFPAAGQTCHAYCTYCFRWPRRFRFSQTRPPAFPASLARFAGQRYQAPRAKSWWTARPPSTARKCSY
jgi:L-lysine 2,3-aminomutase